MELPKHEYLGDGAYVTFTGYSFEIKANSHITPTDIVTLSFKEIENLNHFTQKIFIQQQINAKTAKLKEGGNSG